MNFKKLDTTAKELLKVYLANTGYVGSDFSYHSYLNWFNDVEYVENCNALFLRAFFNGELRYLQPLVKNNMTIKEAVKLLPIDSSFFTATEEFMKEMEDEYVACTNRDWAEYIYKTSDFIALAGKRYSAKRNHISKFLKNYAPEMRPYTAEDKAEFKEFEMAWLTGQSFNENQKESAVKERQLINQQLEASLNGELICDILRVDGKMVGASIGEIMPSGNAVVMFEKADISYYGVYSYLAHEFAVRNLSDCPYINRQEDMGVEGLRKSKSSYYPEFLLHKYVLTPKSRCKTGFEGEIVRPCQGDSSLHENAHDESSNEDMQTKFDNIKQLPLEKYKFLQLLPKDFNGVMSFFKCGIENLENKLFFLNYTDDELLDVLENGFMLGAFNDRHLVATCGFLKDTESDSGLAKICADTTGRQFYEFSGMMVCNLHREKGLSNLVCKQVIEQAKSTLKDATLCAVVQFDNIASLSNLRKVGFEEKAEADFEQYRFKYLTLEIN